LEGPVHDVGRLGYEAAMAMPFDSITAVGPGTPAGEILRRHWQPVAVSAKLAPRQTKPVRALAEDYTLYRGESGRPYLVAGRCPHRLTVLHAGWVEGESLRCMYHGWKFDQGGQCVEQPAEDPAFTRRVRIGSWPVEEYAGLVFAYLGPGEPPPLPRYPEFDDPGIVPYGGVRPPGVWPCNYFQTLENDLDPVHTTFVHRESEPHWSGVPEVSCVETSYGMEVTAARPGYERKTWYHFPNLLRLTVFPIPTETMFFNMLLYTLPVDDGHCMFLLSVALPPPIAGKVASGELVPPGQLPLTADDIREIQTGERRPSGITEEDYLIMVGQGTNADRENEKLGRSDAAVILLRKIWARAVQQEAGAR
jgi:nitrite reductase/ring-hydroxylating ferredoxin subunit